VNSEIATFREGRLNEVVEIHLSAFANYFLSFLGPAFLREFYRSFLSDPWAIALLATDGGPEKRTLGFVVGTLEPAGFFRRLLIRRWWAFGFASIRALCLRPRIAPRLLRALVYRGEVPPGLSRALLSSIAVTPEAQHDGIGRMLLAAWVDKVKSRGSQGCYLTTDAEDNDAVNRFYQRAGWKVESILITPEGRKLNRYIMDFS